MTTPPPPSGYGPPPPGYGPPPPGWGPQQEDVTLPVLVHLSLFVFALIAPLVLWLVVKDDPNKPLARHHALEALNFHISLLIYGVVSAILIIVLVGILMLLALFIASVVLAIIAAVAASRREYYRYPLTLRLVS